MILSTFLQLFTCLLGTSLTFLTSQATANQMYEEVDEPYSNDLINLENAFAEKMRIEFGLHRSCVSRIADRRIEQLEMQFRVFSMATIEEARALELYVIEEYLKTINNCDNLRPYLLEFPFKNVAISISFDCPFGPFQEDSVIYVFFVPGGIPHENSNKILYYSKNSDKDDRITLLKESYEDALKLNARSDTTWHPFKNIDLPSDAAFDQLCEDYNREVSEEIGLNIWSMRGKMSGEISEVATHFIAFNRATPQEAGALLVAASQKMLAAINNNSALQPYLKEFPFPFNRLKMHISFRNKLYCQFRDKTLDSIAMEDGIVTYYSNTPSFDNESADAQPDTPPIIARENYQTTLNTAQKKPVPLKKFKPRPPSFFDYLKYWFDRLIS